MRSSERSISTDSSAPVVTSGIVSPGTKIVGRTVPVKTPECGRVSVSTTLRTVPPVVATSTSTLSGSSLTSRSASSMRR